MNLPGRADDIIDTALSPLPVLLRGDSIREYGVGPLKGEKVSHPCTVTLCCIKKRLQRCDAKGFVFWTFAPYLHLCMEHSVFVCLYACIYLNGTYSM